MAVLGLSSANRPKYRKRNTIAPAISSIQMRALAWLITGSIKKKPRYRTQSSGVHPWSLSLKNRLPRFQLPARLPAAVYFRVRKDINGIRIFSPRASIPATAQYWSSAKPHQQGRGDQHCQSMFVAANRAAMPRRIKSRVEARRFFRIRAHSENSSRFSFEFTGFQFVLSFNDACRIANLIHTFFLDRAGNRYGRCPGKSW